MSFSAISAFPTPPERGRPGLLRHAKIEQMNEGGIEAKGDRTRKRKGCRDDSLFPAFPSLLFDHLILLVLSARMAAREAFAGPGVVSPTLAVLSTFHILIGVPVAVGISVFT